MVLVSKNDFYWKILHQMFVEHELTHSPTVWLYSEKKKKKKFILKIIHIKKNYTLKKQTNKKFHGLFYIFMTIEICSIHITKIYFWTLFSWLMRVSVLQYKGLLPGHLPLSLASQLAFFWNRWSLWHSTKTTQWKASFREQKPSRMKSQMCLSQRGQSQSKHQ